MEWNPRVSSYQDWFKIFLTLKKQIFEEKVVGKKFRDSVGWMFFYSLFSPVCIDFGNKVRPFIYF